MNHAFAESEEIPEQRAVWLDGDIHGRIAFMRRLALEWSQEIMSFVPPGPEQSLALAKVDEALHWAKAGIVADRSLGGTIDDEEE